MNQAGDINVPTLLQYGLDDKITPPEKLREFFPMIGSEQKQKYEYHEMRHRPFDEAGHDLVFANMLGWFDQLSAPKDRNGFTFEVQNSES